MGKLRSSKSIDRIVLEPELEQLFQEHHRTEKDRRFGTSSKGLATVLLGDEMYDRQVRMPKWNGTVSMLMEPKVALRYGPSWGMISTSKNANALRADHFDELRTKLKNEWDSVVDLALGAYGDGNGSLISGIYRGHFPEGVKDRLRFLAQGATIVGEAVHLHRFLSTTRSPNFQ